MKKIILIVEIPHDDTYHNIQAIRHLINDRLGFKSGIIQLPTDKEIYAMAERHYPKADIYFSGNARDISRVAFIAGTNKIIENITE